MKINHVDGITDEDFVKYRNSPDIIAIEARFERLKNGTATEEERLNHEANLKKLAEIPDNLLTSEHILGDKFPNRD